jgi:DNA repair exonuclease SbcCD nuclease subunit
MAGLFKKAAVFTDIHFGLKSNSKTHNDDCERFVDWYIQEAKAQNCDVGIFSGDWHHNRSALNLTTMDASLRSLEKLGKAFKEFYFFPGNHDLYYKDKRDIHSVVFGKHVPGVTVVTEPVIKDDVGLVPWLVGDEWKSVVKMKCKYMFGHFELPHFKMNAMVEMPDTGEVRASDFQYQELVFSGHFHKRQNNNNIWYIGNAFPHNYADAWDDDRGMMILEWGGEPKFINWPDCPKYRTVKLSRLLDKTDEILKPNNLYLRVTLDIDISYEEANFIKENFSKEYDVREISLLPDTDETDDALSIDRGEIEFESVDQIVTDQITKIDSEQYKPNTLLDIYRSL